MDTGLETTNTKKKIFMNHTESDVNIINYDNYEVMGITRDIVGINKYFSKSSIEDCYYKDGFIYYNNKKLIDVSKIILKGEHNYENIMCAILACKVYGVSDEDIIVAGQELRKQGPQSILVTMGNRGAYYFAQDNSIYHCTTAVGKQISAVGAGDSSIAGFIKGLTEGKDIETCLTYSMAAGSATAFSKLLGSYSLFKSLVPKIKVTRIK